MSPEQALQEWRTASRTVDEALRALSAAELDRTDAADLAALADAAVHAAEAALQRAQRVARAARATVEAAEAEISQRRADVTSAEGAEEVARDRHHQSEDRAFERHGYPKREQA